MEILNVAYINSKSSSGASKVCLQLTEAINLTNKGNAQTYSVGDHSINVNGVFVRPHKSLIYDLKTSLKTKDIIVVFHGVWLPRYWLLAFNLILLDIPYVVFPHGSIVRSGLKKSLLKKVFSFPIVYCFVRKSKFIHFLNLEEQKNSFFLSKKFVSISNGIELIKGDVRKKDKKIVFIGRIDVHHKGLDLLVNAVSKLNDFSEYLFEIYGDGPEKEMVKLRKMIEASNCDSKIKLYPGRLNEIQIVSLLNSSAGFVHTSRYEGEPLMVLNALHNNCPVFATEATNCKNIVHSKNGLICGNSADSISKMLPKFIKNITQDKYQPYLDLDDRSWHKIAVKVINQYKCKLGFEKNISRD